VTINISRSYLKNGIGHFEILCRPVGTGRTGATPGISRFSGPDPFPAGARVLYTQDEPTDNDFEFGFKPKCVLVRNQRIAFTEKRFSRVVDVRRHLDIIAMTSHHAYSDTATMKSQRFERVLHN